MSKPTLKILIISFISVPNSKSLIEEVLEFRDKQF